MHENLNINKEKIKIESHLQGDVTFFSTTVNLLLFNHDHDSFGSY